MWRLNRQRESSARKLYLTTAKAAARRLSLKRRRIDTPLQGFGAAGFVPRPQICRMRHRLYLHFAWTTRDREPLITAQVAEFLGRFLPGVAFQERSRIIALGLVKTHVHVLAELHATTNIPRLLQRWKGGSAALAGKEGVTRPLGLRWAKWYSLTSVSPSQLDAVTSYVAAQATHHPTEAIPGWIRKTTAASAVDAEPRL